MSNERNYDFLPFVKNVSDTIHVYVINVSDTTLKYYEIW